MVPQPSWVKATPWRKPAQATLRGTYQVAMWTRMPCCRPRSWISRDAWNLVSHSEPPAAWMQSSEAMIEPPTARVISSSLLATFTTSPTTVNSMRSLPPRLPTVTGPQWIPIDTRSGLAPRVDDFEMGQTPQQLTPEQDARWLEAWSRVQQGG